ncbi:MAG: C69 family dipeptidase [Bacteroidales bacterium]|nr:C69 family dipeptidase [Bacteroidales bacterium]
MKKVFTLAFLLLGGFFCGAQNDNCFGIIVGKNASSTGEVILGHNEDDGGEQMLNIYAGSEYIWAEFPGMEVADAFMNKYGVAIVSDNCPSRSTDENFFDGGVCYEVRVAVAKQAKTAREAVDIIGHLVETRGYKKSGRTYLVADPNEAWVVAVAQGRQWVAQRVPDDAVMIIPNYYTIDRVDFADPENFAGTDVFSYATSRGWYNFRTDGNFSFRKTFATPESRTKENNLLRHRAALAYFGQPQSENADDIPFCFKPAKKVSVEDVMGALSLHQPAWASGSICNPETVVSTIFQLRSSMPREIGCVMWTAMGRPAVEAYLPIYLGTTELPAFGRFFSAADAERRHFTDAKNLRIHTPSGFYWKHVDRWAEIEKDLYKEAAATQYAKKYQAKMLKEQAAFEQSCMGYFSADGTLRNAKSLAKRLNKAIQKNYEKYVKGF